MIVHRAYVQRLHGTAEQEEAFARFAGVCRLVYNLALEQRRDHWRNYMARTGKRISAISQSKELTELRAKFDWIAETPQVTQEYALRDLDRAFRGFFAGRNGYPSPRRKGLNDAFRFKGREARLHRLNRRWGVVKLPKIGEVRFRWTRDIPGRLLNVTVKRDAHGWSVIFACEVEIEAAPPSKPAIGVDRGVTRALALSDGTFRDAPTEQLNVLDRRARKQARKLARCKRGSNRRAAAKKTLARTKAKAARVRRHWNHVQSSRLARDYGVIVLEALETGKMTRRAKGSNVRQKAGLNRAILDKGWHQFQTFLEYKLAAAGGELRLVNPAFTSQACSDCGTIDKRSRESQARFNCAHCGHIANADTNAAINILRAGTRPSQREPVAALLKREPRAA